VGYNILIEILGYLYIKNIMFSDPIKNIEQFDINPGDSVADFGSGSGHYSLALAKTVGETGMVYAIDIQKDLLSKIKNEAVRRGLLNIEVVWGDLEKVSGSRLKDGAVKAVVVSNLMFQISDKLALAKEAFRVLEPKGKLLLVDWSDSFGGIGPHRDMVFSEDNAKNIFSEAGFIFQKNISAGKHHYGLIFTKS
jgi:ubiquinone/menaquinone biosynthesis C-methylase UbiE